MSWWQGGQDPYLLYNQGRQFPNTDYIPSDRVQAVANLFRQAFPALSEAEVWAAAWDTIERSSRGEGLFPVTIATEALAEREENRWTTVVPAPAQPIRRKWFMYGCAEVAFDLAKRLHQVHPEQHKKNPATDGQTEMRMPGGATGTKRTRVVTG